MAIMTYSIKKIMAMNGGAVYFMHQELNHTPEFPIQKI
jgi:hypothetical protein